MKEALNRLKHRVDIVPSEAMGLGGAVTALTCAAFIGRIGGAEDVAFFSGIFAITAVARDVGCGIFESVSDKIGNRNNVVIKAPLVTEAGRVD